MLTDWLMVIITFVYVVATIFICVYNSKSAKAADEQTQEMKRQSFLTNRPILSMEMVYIRRAFFALRITNNGNQTAFNTIIEINQSFIDSLPEKNFKDLLSKNKNKVKNIGVGQSYDIFFGSNKFLELENKLPISGRIIYCGNDNSTYAEDFKIEIGNYATFFSVDSDIDDLKKEMKNQTQEIKRLVRAIEYLADTQSKKAFSIEDMADELIEETKQALIELGR